MRTHAKIVGGIQNARRIAELSGASLNTVRSWGQRNSIPAEHWPALVEAGVATLEELVRSVRPRQQPADQQVAA